MILFDHGPCAGGRGSFMACEIEKFRINWMEYFQESFPSCIGDGLAYFSPSFYKMDEESLLW